MKKNRIPQKVLFFQCDVILDVFFLSQPEEEQQDEEQPKDGDEEGDEGMIYYCIC